MQSPEIQYARRGDFYLAYQVFGAGPIDLLTIVGGPTHLELRWDEPGLARAWARMGEFARVIVYDKLGFGLSSRVTEFPPFEDQVADAVAVLDAAHSEQAVVVGYLDGGTVAMLLAAQHPDRVDRLVLEQCTARLLAASDHPHGLPSDVFDTLIDLASEGRLGEVIVPASLGRAGDDRYRRWSQRYVRSSIDPGAACAWLRRVAATDLRPILPTIAVPTIVVHASQSTLFSEEASRELASFIPGARFALLDGVSEWVSASGMVWIEEIEEFVTGLRVTERSTRVVTVLFTDIVGSTERAATAGDARWQEILAAHNEIVRDELARFGGHEVSTAGDGFLAWFETPAQAIRCALRIAEAVRQVDLEVRAGLHAGEVAFDGTDLRGIAVHVGARVAALAGGGCVYVSRTVADLAAGSGFQFEDAGTHLLKGVTGEWQIFQVSGVQRPR